MINNRFHILRFLGEGRSRVFLCSDKFNICQLYAIKVLSPAAIPEEIAAFRREFEILQKFSHPNIVKVYEYGKIFITQAEDRNAGIETGSEFFTMEYCEGKKISDFEFKHKPELLLKVVEQISAFLFFLHLSEHIYFDLKAENIIINPDENDLNIKFIDFGSVEKISEAARLKRKGTAIYMAPEILENKKIDHRADLYSFGILLYRLVYGRYPVESDDELVIFNEKLKGDFAFSIGSFPGIVFDILKKLLAVNPSERFENTLEILNLLGAGLEDNLYNWFSASGLIENEKVTDEIYKYVNDPERRDALIIRGDAGSGKTSIAHKIKKQYNNVVFIENLSGQDPNYFPTYISNKIIFTEQVFNSLGEEEIEELSSFSVNEHFVAFEELKKSLVKFTRKGKLILLIDDFNLLDEVVKEFLLQLFPILQVNNNKIILLSGSQPDEIDNLIKSKSELHIPALSEAEIKQFVSVNFAKFFPKRELEELIVKYSDHLPGNILQFLRDLTIFDMIKASGPEIIADVSVAENIIKWSQRQIYENRLLRVKPEELVLLEIISAVDINIDLTILTNLSGFQPAQINRLLVELGRKNIITADEKHSAIQFTSKGLKSFVYGNIADKKSLHEMIASECGKYRNFSIVELSRQYELSGQFEKCYEVLLPEIERAQRVSAFSYLKKIYGDLCRLPLPLQISEDIKVKQIDVLLKSGEPGTALKIIKEIENSDSGLGNEILGKKGICLINTGKAEEGKILLLEALEKIEDSEEKTELILEIANAELNTNDFENVYAICQGIIEDSYSTGEQLGRAFNFLGIVEIYKNDNLEGAISYFEKALLEFERAGLQHRIARLKINIGNIYNMKGEHVKAEEFWNSSLKINTSIGDIEQEALLLMNYGIFNFDKCNFEKAQDFYNRACTIFSTTGNKNGEALALFNSSETHLFCCEYEKSLERLEKAKSIFAAIGNREEEASCSYMKLYNYYYLGCSEYYLREINRYSALISEHNLGEKHEFQLSYMKNLSKLIQGFIPDEIFIRSVHNSIFRFYNSENLNDCCFAATELIKILSEEQRYHEIYKLISEERIEKAFLRNPVGEAYFYWFKAELKLNYDFSETSAQSYLFNSYEIIKEQSITDLTWQALFSMGKSYYERGLYKNSIKFLRQAKLLIYFIAENINDELLRISYLERQDRKNILESIDRLEKLITGL